MICFALLFSMINFIHNLFLSLIYFIISYINWSLIIIYIFFLFYFLLLFFIISLICIVYFNHVVVLCNVWPDFFYNQWYGVWMFTIFWIFLKVTACCDLVLHNLTLDIDGHISCFFIEVDLRFITFNHIQLKNIYWTINFIYRLEMNRTTFIQSNFFIFWALDFKRILNQNDINIVFAC